MSVYPPKVKARFHSPSYAGSVANAVGTSASFECGSFARMSLSIPEPSNVIEDARFQTNGCGYMIAAADVIAQRLISRELTDLHSVEESEFVRNIETELGKFPEERLQCVHVVIEALRAALADHRAYLIEEFSGEKALICTCFGVSEEVIEAYISMNSPDSVEEITAACSAGGGCGSCQMLIQEMIDSHNVEAGS